VFDTNLVIVGNVLTAPEWRRVTSTNTLLANFRVASTARRFDRETGRWVDGNSLRMRVTAWRRLAEGIAASIKVGDPVIIYGRLYSRDWKDENDKTRVTYEVEAYSIGHDLARGRANFFRNKAAQGTASLEDTEEESLVGGDMSLPVAGEEAPVRYGDGLPEQFPGEEVPLFTEPDPEPEPVPVPVAEGGDEEADDLTLEVERLVATPPRRARRTRREPVAA
jgi:single-strand DNA-binding protein